MRSYVVADADVVFSCREEHMCSMDVWVVTGENGVTYANATAISKFEVIGCKERLRQSSTNGTESNNSMVVEEYRQSGADANHTVAHETATNSVVAEGGQQSSTADPTSGFTAVAQIITKQCAAVADQSKASAAASVAAQPSTSSATQPVVTGSQQVHPEPVAAGNHPATEPDVAGNQHGPPAPMDPWYLPAGNAEYPRECSTIVALTPNEIQMLGPGMKADTYMANNLIKWLRHIHEEPKGCPRNRVVDLTDAEDIIVPYPSRCAQDHIDTFPVGIRSAVSAHYWFDAGPPTHRWSWRQFVAREVCRDNLQFTDTEAVVRFECAIDPRGITARDETLWNNSKRIVDWGVAERVYKFEPYSDDAPVPILRFLLYTSENIIFSMDPMSDGECDCRQRPDPDVRGRATLSRPGPTQSGRSYDGRGSFHGVETTNHQGTGSSSSRGAGVAVNNCRVGPGVAENMHIPSQPHVPMPARACPVYEPDIPPSPQPPAAIQLTTRIPPAPPPTAYTSAAAPVVTGAVAGSAALHSGPASGGETNKGGKTHIGKGGKHPQRGKSWQQHNALNQASQRQGYNSWQMGWDNSWHEANSWNWRWRAANQW